MPSDPMPCPWCGKKPTLCGSHPGDPFYWYNCETCETSCSRRIWPSAREALTQWNNQRGVQAAVEKAVAAERDRIERVIRAACHCDNGHTEDGTECEYCGRPIAAVRDGGEACGPCKGTGDNRECDARPDDPVGSGDNTDLVY